jgi:hypothetical protein
VVEGQATGNLPADPVSPGPSRASIRDSLEGLEDHDRRHHVRRNRRTRWDAWQWPRGHLPSHVEGLAECRLVPVAELGASLEPDGRTGDRWTPVLIVSPKVRRWPWSGARKWISEGPKSVAERYIGLVRVRRSEPDIAIRTTLRWWCLKCPSRCPSQSADRAIELPPMIDCVGPHLLVPRPRL